MKHINDTFQRIVLIVLFAALAYLVVVPAKACEVGESLDMGTKQCEDINTTVDEDLNNIVNGKWNEKEHKYIYNNRYIMIIIPHQ